LLFYVDMLLLNVFEFNIFLNYDMYK